MTFRKTNNIVHKSYYSYNTCIGLFYTVELDSWAVPSIEMGLEYSPQLVPKSAPMDGRISLWDSSVGAKSAPCLTDMATIDFH